jgi:O-6-methylguanine DNA methyltransferase
MKKLKLPQNGIVTGCVETLFGWVSYAVSVNGLKECRFMYGTKQSAVEAISKLFDQTSAEEDKAVNLTWDKAFGEYFSGKLKVFDKIPLDSHGWTEFQQKVYNTVKSIPYGKTASYGTIASFLGNRNASRAVGHALKMNPVPPFIPCHRVIAADKELCGFSALGGLDLKLKMLELEKDNARSI